MTDSPSPSTSEVDSVHPKGMSRIFRSVLGITLPIAAIVIALVISGVILLVAGYDPVQAFEAMWSGAFGDIRSISEVLLNATPLIMIGAGLTVAFRCSMWNIGAEGQFYVGAVAATAVGIALPGLPGIILIPLVLLLGVVGGALWAMLAGFLKVRYNASEIVTTIMLNFIAIISTGYLVTGPMIEEVGKYPQTAQIAEAAWLPRFLPPTRLHIGFILAVVLAVLIYILIFKTSVGYAIRAVGVNKDAARYAGINVNRNIMLAMAISGGTAGLAGAVTIAGLTFRLYQTISPGFGFEGIAVALLANNHPIGVIFTGILFGALRSGSEIMQMNAKIPSVLVFAIQGLIILTVVIFGVYQQRFQKKRV